MSHSKGQKSAFEPPLDCLVRGWQPIETAPKGEQVLINCPGKRVATAFYQEQPFIGNGWHVVVPCMGGFGNGSDTFVHWPEDQPTHWMPLPEAPNN